MYKIKNNTTGEILELKEDKQFLSMMKKNFSNLKDFEVSVNGETTELAPLILKLLSGIVQR